MGRFVQALNHEQATIMKERSTLEQLNVNNHWNIDSLIAITINLIISEYIELLILLCARANKHRKHQKGGGY